MQGEKTGKLVKTALFSALCCVASMVLQIPSPMSGYVNLGDSMALLAGWILGPLYGTISAGLGSMLADILLGYLHYAPATLLIKAAVALSAGLLFRLWQGESRGGRFAARFFSGVIAEAIMTAGYFCYAALLFGEGWGAAATVPGNVMQGIFGIAAAMLLMGVLEKNKLLKKL